MVVVAFRLLSFALIGERPGVRRMAASADATVHRIPRTATTVARAKTGRIRVTTQFAAGDRGGKYVGSVRLADVVSEGEGDCFGAIGDADFGVEVGDMAFDGAYAEEKFVGNRTVAAAVGDQTKDVKFTRC